MDYLSEKNWIEKSRTLIYAEWSKFDIHELQIFETYLSRINPRDPESSCVRFTKTEYAEMMGYENKKSLKTKTLDKWVKNFMQKQISIAFDGGTRHFNLFSDATVYIDSETGEVVVDLDCNSKLKPVFFNIAETGYISYRRKNTINFKSEYTLKLYCMLKDHCYGNYEWTVDLKELRNILGATEPLYEKFAEFNRRILKKAEEEINENSDISFSFEKITRGRLTRAIKFKIHQSASNKQIDGQNTIFDYLDSPQQPAKKYQNELYEFYAEACNYEFSEAEIEELSFLAKPHILGAYGIEAYQTAAFDYLRAKYAALNAKKDVQNRFGYMKFLVREDK